MKRGLTTAKEAWQERIIDSIMAEVRRRKEGRYCVLSDVVRMCNAILVDRLYHWKLTEKPSEALRSANTGRQVRREEKQENS